MTNSTDAFMSKLPGPIFNAPAKLTDFEDFVDAGLALAHKRDDNAWALGDLAVSFMQTFPVIPGRPIDPDQPTLSDLASAWDVEKPRVSEWHSVSAFFQPKFRTFDNLSWGHYNAARRAAKGDIEEAIDLLEKADALHMGIRKFKRFLAGDLWEGFVGYVLLPPDVQAMVNPGEQIWATYRRGREDD